MTHFSEILKTLRIESGLTQAQMADDLGVSQSAIYYWENGKREPNFETLDKIISYFNISKNVSLDSAWENYSGETEIEKKIFGSSYKRQTFTEYIRGLSLISNFGEEYVEKIFLKKECQLNTILGKAKELNKEGRKKIIEYEDDLILSGKYKKTED